MPIATINPATGEVIQTFQPLSEKQIEEKLQLAVSAFQAEGKTSFAERARRMTKAAEILERDKEKFGHLMTLEMGKPYKAAVAEAVKSASGCRYYAENAERFLTDEAIDTGTPKKFYPLPSHRLHSRRDAVEFPFLAGVSLCRSGADGRQRWTAEACLERAAVRSGD